MRLKNNGVVVNFDPGADYDAPGARRVSIHEVLSGKHYIYTRSSKGRWEVPIVAMGESDAEIIEEWRLTADLTWYPDYEYHPGISFPVRILNVEAPLQKAYPNWDLYSGELILREI
jgi:hypothetical protein